VKKDQLLEQAYKSFENIPRESLGFFPTPLHRLNNISARCKAEVWIKRDDLTGPSIFGGNKTRKLEYLLGRAKKEGHDHVITYGATQSNHAMQTAIACRKVGLKAILYLVAVVPPGEGRPLGNLLLDRIMDAEIHIEPCPSGDASEAMEKARSAAAARIKELEKEGSSCYEIPPGGANDTGSLGYVQALMELCEQIRQEPGLSGFDHVYQATGTGGTLAGLLAGKELLQEDFELVPVDVGLVKPGFKEQAAALAGAALSLLGRKSSLDAGSFTIEESFTGPGYEMPSVESSSALKELALEEGILVGPVYTAKAFAALLGHLQGGKIKENSRVLFWHTGGASELFAEAQITGDNIIR